jgi:exodeoxyribonuclease-3
LGGDFNICPAALDSWDEERLAGDIFHTDEERSRFRRLLDWGLRDLYREKHPDGRDFSWWDYRGGAFHRGHGLRIDFLLGTEPVAARLASIEIDREWRKKQDGLTASDHAPVMAELR